MNKSNAIIILFFSAIYCCTPKEKQVSKIRTQTIGSVEIPISQDFNPDRTRTQYIHSDSGEYLALLNKTNFSIGIFNLNEKRLQQTIPLTKEGPNGIGLDNGFHIFSKDCLFVATIPPKIRVLNFKGELKTSIAIENKLNAVNFLSANNETPFLFNKKKLFGIQPFFEDFFEISQKKAESTESIYSVNLTIEEPQIKWLPIYRPSGLWEEGKKDENLSWSDRYDSIIVAPYTDHRVWVISKEKENLISHVEVRSSHVNQFQIVSKSSIGGDKGIIESLKNDRYEIMLFDPYRDVFYRFFFPGIDAEDYTLTPRQLLSNRPLVGVLILGNDLKPVGEHIFDKHQIQSWNYFVGRKGLYVSTNNPNRDDFDENFLRYDIIRFEGLNYED